MFNLFGSFFFGARNTQTTNEQEEQQQQQQEAEQNLVQRNEASTQTQPQPLMQHSQVLNGDKEWVIVDKNGEHLGSHSHASVNTSSILAESTLLTASQMVCIQEQDEREQKQQQSRLVEEEEEEEFRIENEERTMSKKKRFHSGGDESESAAESDAESMQNDEEDVLLGSFFDRQLVDQQPMAPVPRDEWLITPLPCLTSITSSQRSMVDDDPLENLLIEHPSMSVFVTLTSTTNYANADYANELVLVAATMPNEYEEKGGQKRKVAETVDCSTVVVSSANASPTATMKRKEKKSKKNGQAVSAAGKENVKALLMNEFKKQTSAQAKLDAALFNKNQMKRNNKNAVFGKFTSVNTAQRKFHKLQQPAC